MMKWRKRAWWVAKGVIVGALLAASLLQGERLWLPPGLQEAGHLLYRCAYWIAFPTYCLIRPLGHWAAERSFPGWFWLAVGLAAPWFYLSLWAGFRWLRQHTAPIHPSSNSNEFSDSRRQVLIRAGAGAAVGLGSGLLGVASLIEPQRLTVRRYRMNIADLPQKLDGLRIAQLSDTHYGAYVPLGMVREAIALAGRFDPDLVVLTGDYVHRTPRAIGPGIGIFEHLRPRLGTLAVLGNHDHWQGAEACRNAFGQLGIALVDNGRRFLTRHGLTQKVPDASEVICIAGVGDLWTDEVEPAQALADVPAKMPRLLLSHNPDVAESLPEKLRIDLMLSGHTHGGQVRLPLVGAPIVPSDYGQKYVGGLCHGPLCPVIVSRGVGMAVMPLRLGVPPEVVLIELIRQTT